jgi:hypothetical protein
MPHGTRPPPDKGGMRDGRRSPPVSGDPFRIEDPVTTLIGRLQPGWALVSRLASSVGWASDGGVTGAVVAGA